MKKEYFTIPNLLTLARLVGAIVLIFIKPMSVPFLVIYTLAGLTDAFDGYAARKLNQESEFGSKLDSVSDLTFYAVMLLKVFPILYAKLPKRIWIFVLAVIVFRLFMYIINAVIRKEMLTSHSYLNKASGLLIFCLPYLIPTTYLEPYSWSIVGVVIVAAIYEFTYSLYHAYLKNHFKGN
ncbi:MAG: CDP-alcohol phosphatidyltransferase family protein [Erysipelotrichaceae bacterium]|nr:CDP-alcohol phosphatidyltransferase family protein [Erysipelotrichaceae bacterium]